MNKRRLVVVIVVVVVGVVAVPVLALTQPWKAFVDTTVNESFPTPTTAGDNAIPVDPNATTPQAADSPDPVALVAGSFVPKDKDASGTAVVYDIGGQQVLRLEDFATSDGPDMFIVLSPHPVGSDNATLSQGYLSLGSMKGNIGNQNYDIPPGTDLSAYQSVIVWCDRFTSAFGASELAPV